MIDYFVSSTFRDMQSERDALQNIILPEIRKFANIRGQDIFLTDLRWGIDTSNTNLVESMNKIMNICVSEIDHCHPHMIILLGDRYGSIPDANSFDAFLNSPQGQCFSGEDKGKSITEMEIIHGLFHLPNSGDFTICIRDSLHKEEIGNEMVPVYFETESPYIEKLAQLKKTLIEKYPQNVLRYSVKWNKDTHSVIGLEDFINKLTARLYSQIAKTFSAPKTPEKAQQNADDLFVSSKSKSFSGRKKQLLDIHEFVCSSDYSRLIVVGASGVGKSYLMAKVAEVFSKTHCVIAFFCGNSPVIHSKTDLLHNLIYRLCCILNTNYAIYENIDSIFSLKGVAESLIRQIREKLIIIVDSIDSLDVIDSEKDTVFLPDINDSNNCKIIVSTKNNMRGRLLYHNELTFRLDVMDEEELSEMLDLRLLELRKELPVSTKEIMLKKILYHTPLYSSMVFQRIFCLNQFDYKELSTISVKTGEESKALYYYMENELNALPDQESDLIIHIAESYRNIIQFSFQSVVLQILCAFPDGLRTEDVIGIAQKLGVQVSVLDLKTYLNCLDSMIYTTHNNRILFMHNTILKSLSDRFSNNLDSVYQAAFLYFKDTADDDSVKLSDFIRISYCCKEYEAIADYLSKLYITEEKIRLNSKENVNLIITAMTSLKRAFQEIQNENAALDFIKTVINSIPEENVEKIYGMCCSFLFSYDTFFSTMALENRVTDIMQLINDKCVRVLYPHREENPLYLRAIYVSYEQLGIRTSNYETIFHAYSLFNHYCLELFMMTQHQSKYRLDIINDLSLSYSKLGDLFMMRNWRKALAFYEKAIETAKLSCENDARKAMLIYRMHVACCEKARCVIQKAIQNNMIGWSMDDEMQQELDKSKDMLLAAIKYISLDNKIEDASKNVKLAYCYRDLADWARATVSVELELNYTKKMIEFAEAAYKRNQSILMYDLIRNGEFRLGYRPVINQQEEKHLQKAFCMATEIRQELDTEMTEKILYYSGGRLLLYYSDRIERLTLSNDTDAVSAMCIEALSKFIPILNILYSGNDGEKHYHATIDLFKKALYNIDVQRQLAIQELNRHNCREAYKKAVFTFRLLLAMKGQIDSKEWLSQMLDACNLLSVCSHNVIAESYKYDTSSLKAKEYLVTEISAIAKMYYLILSYEMHFLQDELLKAYKDIYTKLPGNYICSLYGLLEFAAENIVEPSSEETFWEYINKINYRIPNLRTVYFDTMRDKQMKKLFDKHVQIIGKYFYEHFQDERVQKLLYFSLLFEDIALEYAYQVMDYEVANRIIENGYDRYLELSTLYIIRKHDREEFYKRANELKFVCIIAHRKLIRQYYNLNNITGSLFISEANELFKTIIKASKTTDPNDPRMHSKRSVYKYQHK